MSGTSIVYGDRPITRTAPDGGYATPEFLQFLERLSRGHSALTAGGAELVPQVNANTAAITNLNDEVNTLQDQMDQAISNDRGMLGLINSLQNRSPTESAVASTGALALTSGTATQLTSLFTSPNVCIIVGTVCLTGSGSVTTCRISVGPTSAVIETAPGSFLTGWFGGGASPSGLSMDLTVGSLTRMLHVTTPSTIYLNVNAAISGAISAYGSLIVWPLGG